MYLSRIQGYPSSDVDLSDESINQGPSAPKWAPNQMKKVASKEQIELEQREENSVFLFMQDITFVNA